MKTCKLKYSFTILICLFSVTFYAQEFEPKIEIGGAINFNTAVIHGNISNYFNNPRFVMVGENLYLKYKSFTFFKIGIINVNQPNSHLKESFSYNDKIWSPDSITRWGQLFYLSLGYSIIDTKHIAISPFIGSIRAIPYLMENRL